MGRERFFSGFMVVSVDGSQPDVCSSSDIYRNDQLVFGAEPECVTYSIYVCVFSVMSDEPWQRVPSEHLGGDERSSDSRSGSDSSIERCRAEHVFQSDGGVLGGRGFTVDIRIRICVSEQPDSSNRAESKRGQLSEHGASTRSDIGELQDRLRSEHFRRVECQHIFFDDSDGDSSSDLELWVTYSAVEVAIVGDVSEWFVSSNISRQLHHELSVL